MLPKLPKLPKRRDNKLHSDNDQDSVHAQPEYHQMDYSSPSIGWAPYAIYRV